MKRLLLAFSVLLSAVRFLSASELHETLLSAHAAYLQGRFDEAATSYRYAVALDPNDLEAETDLALTLRDQGRYAEAEPLWLKATLLAPQDSWVREQRAWNFLQQGRYDEAHDQFRRALVASSAAPSLTLTLGDGLAYAQDHERDEATKRFKAALLLDGADPLPMVLLAGVQQAQGDNASALIWYRHALQQDPKMREAEEGAARALKAQGEPEAAWQLAAHLLQSDADDPALLALSASLRSSLRKRTADLLPVRRVAWPLLDAPQPAPAGGEVRVALFADARGVPAELSSFTFITNTAFRINDKKIGDVTSGARMQLWVASYDPASSLVSVKAVGGGESYATRNAIELLPEPGGDLLIKDAAMAAAPGRDVGDRELRGRLLLEPGPGGMRLSLSSAIEDYVRGALSVAAPDENYPESLKALAVVLRARALARGAGKSLHPGAPYSHCDSAHCGVFLGVQDENPRAAEAVAQTRGWALSWHGAPLEALDHLACGGHTQSAEGLGQDVPYLTEVADGPALVSSPSALERFTQSRASVELLDAAHPENGSAVRWSRVLDAARLEERLRRMGLKGKLKDILPGARTPEGRLLELRVVSSQGVLVLKGDADLARALSPGSLRSSLLTLRVLKRRGRPDLVLLWGAGTGHGLGLCRMGADGLASQGKDARQILEHYFPKAEITAQAPRPEGKPAPKKAAKGRRTL